MKFLRGLAAILELTPRVSDLIVSFGELFSSRIVAAAFRELGINSTHIDARQIIITDSQFQKAIPQDALDRILSFPPPVVENTLIVLRNSSKSNPP